MQFAYVAAALKTVHAKKVIGAMPKQAFPKTLRMR